jgi:hypothetical protein
MCALMSLHYMRRPYVCSSELDNIYIWIYTEILDTTSNN